MAFHRHQRGENRRGNSRRFNESDSRPRKGSNDIRRNRNNSQDLSDSHTGRRFHRNNRNDGPGGKRRFIKKDHKRPEPKKDDEIKDDLDRQMRDYWIKTGSKKGAEELKGEQNIATKKMNQEMDDYWKKAGEKKV